MPFHFPQRCAAWIMRLRQNDWRALLLGCVALSLALTGLAWTITWQRLDAEKALLERNTRLQQENLAAIIGENLSQVLDRGQLMSIAANEWFEGKRDDATNRLAAMRAGDRAFLRLALYDARLQRVYSSSPGRDAAQLQAELQQALQAATADGSMTLRVGSLPAADEAAWQVPLIWPVRAGDNAVQGVLLLVLDLGYFLGFYQNIEIGHTGVIQILRADGAAIAEVRPAGLVLRNAGQPVQLPLAGRSRGSLTVDLFAEGNFQLASFQALSRYPFVVAVSRGVEEILATHQSSRKRFFAALLVLSAIIALATYWVARSIRQQGLLFTALAEADADKLSLIAQLEEEKSRAFKLAAHDHLTGLPNRRMFHELVVSHLSRAKRSRKHYALLYLDLDRFKPINDELGHHVGDLLLQAVAGRLKATLRESDLVARLGGDEFAILLTGLENIGDTAAIAAKLVEQIGQPFTDLDGKDLQVGSSIGIALFPRDGHDFDTLCRHADGAMYQSKRSGRGQFTFYDPDLNLAGQRLLNLEQRLPHAIAGNELVLHFQPKVRLSDYRIVGFEALLRWQHPELGLIYPNDFVPLAEHAACALALGDWVAAACCRELAAWRAAGAELVPLSCNLSPQQLHDPALPQRLAGILAQHGLAPGLLTVEISESSLGAATEIAGPVLHALAAQGIRIALDNFGNGFSNFAHIRTLPIHCLKIDKAFVGRIRNNSDDAVIVASIITLAHNLRMQVVAEGVELLDQLVHLKTAGCDEAQGYFLSRPLPGEAALRLLQTSILAPT